MNESELIEFLRDNLSIETAHERDYGNEYYVVRLMLNGECISSDTISLTN